MSSYAGIPARHFLMPFCFTLLDVEVAPLLVVKVARPRLHLLLCSSTVTTVADARDCHAATGAGKSGQADDMDS